MLITLGSIVGALAVTVILQRFTARERYRFYRNSFVPPQPFTKPLQNNSRRSSVHHEFTHTQKPSQGDAVIGVRNVLLDWGAIFRNHPAIFKGVRDSAVEGSEHQLFGGLENFLSNSDSDFSFSRPYGSFMEDAPPRDAQLLLLHYGVVRHKYDRDTSTSKTSGSSETNLYVSSSHRLLGINIWCKGEHYAGFNQGYKPCRSVADGVFFTSRNFDKENPVIALCKGCKNSLDYKKWEGEYKISEIMYLINEHLPVDLPAQNFNDALEQHEVENIHRFARTKMHNL